MVNWIISTMNSLGYLGIGLLMFLENVFPPIPSELIMPLAGFSATQGKLQLGWVIVAGVIGTILGTLPWYYAGVHLGERRLKNLANKYGKWLTISSDDIDRAKIWFDRYGGKAVFIGRLVPGIRTVISLPAGLSEMNFVKFLLYSTLGTTVWVSVLTLLGYVLGENYTLVETYLGPISKIVLVILVIGAILFIVQRKRRSP